MAKGDIVRLAEDGRITRADDATKADLYTYATTLLRVVDGDTIVVAIGVAPGVVYEEKLRLRGLDCPEMKTPEGKVAKRFTDTAVADATSLTIYTTKPDKYDRYLADVYFGQQDGDDLFLNNALLTNGQAVRKEAWEFGDWDKGLV